MTGRGDRVRAAGLLQEALDTEREREVRFYSAETHRLLGESMWSAGEKEGAIAQLRESLEIAARQRARSLELRAATSLAGIADDPTESRRIGKRLREILETFEEGHDTTDFREATSRAVRAAS